MALRFESVALAFALSWTPAAAEDCLVCDPEVVMTPALAKCFVDRAAATLDEMDRNNLDYQLVNLGTCDGVDGDTRSGDETADSLRQIISWSDIRNAREGTPTEVTTAFILDRTGILCLEAAIRTNPAAFDPAAAFRPSEMCSR